MLVFPVIISQQKRVFMNTLGELWEDYEHSCNFTRDAWPFSSRLRNCCERKLFHFFPHMASLKFWYINTKILSCCPLQMTRKEFQKSENSFFLFFTVAVLFLLQPLSNIIILVPEVLLVFFLFFVCFLSLLAIQVRSVLKIKFPISWKIYCNYI